MSPLSVSNADRVVFPEDGLTKGDVVDYYGAAAAALFPFVAGRGITVERYPRGLSEEGFMQKNAPDHYPDELFDRFEVPKEGGGTTVYPVPLSEAAIPYLANQGVITFHAPPVLVSDEALADWAIWDLDPTEGEVAKARAAVIALREVLQAHGIEAAPMTSGSKGYHLRVPLDPPLPVDDVSRLTRGVAALAAESHPDLLTLAFRKAERGAKVFVDWLRNSPRSTAVAPWSLRARDGAPVAAPLRWGDVDEVEPDSIRITQAIERMPSRPWADIPAQDLAAVIGVIDSDLSDAGIVLEPFDRFRS